MRDVARVRTRRSGRPAPGCSPAACTPPATATVVRPSGDDVLITDGPYLEGKEHVGGFWIIRAAGPGRRAGVGAQGCAAATTLPIEVRPFQARADALACRHARRGRAGLPRASTAARWPSWSASSATSTLAEEAVQDAFTAAVQRWPATGCRPARPAGSSPPPATGRSTGCAGRRRAPTGTPRRRCCTRRREPAEEGAGARRPAAPDLHLLPPGAGPGRPGRADPAAARRADHAEIARAFLVPEPTMAQRLVRAKAQDPRRRHPVPGARARPTCPTGCAAVLAVVYLIFNEGYTASSGDRAGPRRPVRRGDPARPAAGRADAGRAGGARDCSR